MKRTFMTVILTFAFTVFTIQAVAQTAFSGAGIIESTTGGFKFPDGTVLTSTESGKPWGIAWVSQGGGDYDDPNQAMDDIETWCPDRSQSSPCLIRMGPGTWTMGDTPIELLSNVHIQGSGGSPVPRLSQTALTIIKGTITGSDTGVIVSRDGGSLRDLVVINESTGSYGSAIYVQGGVHFYISDVQAAAGNAVYSYGLRIQSTLSVQTVVYAYNSRFESIGDTSYARGVYMYGSTNHKLVQFICKSCELSAVGLSNAHSLYASAGSGANVSATIEHSKSGRITSAGSGSRSISVYYSTIYELALNTGTSKSCVFTRVGLTAHTNTCP